MSKFAPTIAAVAACMLIAATTASAEVVRSARPEVSVTAPATTVDLRSPDARDSGRSTRPTVAQDLRSPDAREAGRYSSTGEQPQPGGGSDWVYLALAGVLSIAFAAGVLLVVQRRRGRVVTASS